MRSWRQRPRSDRAPHPTGRSAQCCDRDTSGRLLGNLPGVNGRIRRLYDFELDPEVRDWLDSLSDSDFKRVDEVCGMLAETGTELGGPWSDYLEGPVWELPAAGTY